MKNKLLATILLIPSFALGQITVSPSGGGGGGGSGDALTTNPLSQFAATTSSQFKGVISDENAPDGASSKVIMALGSLSIATGKTATFSNTLTLAGTDSTTMTFPTTNASIARTDAANTFAGTQTFSGQISAATGTTGLAPINIPTGTLKTTPASGDVENDGSSLYATNSNGNRGAVAPHYIIRADATVTQANDANAHAIFTTPTNGRLTLPVGTYRFRGLLQWTAMSATSGNIKVDMLGAGTATIGSWLWAFPAVDSGANQVAGTASLGTANVSGSVASIATAGAATGCTAILEGSFEVTGTGTLIPTQTLVTAAAAVLSVGSYLEFWWVGSTSMTSVGPWD